MKNLLLLISAGFLFLEMNGQQKFQAPLSYPASPEFVSPSSQNPLNPPPISFLIDYNLKESQSWAGTPGGGYGSFVWPMHKRYVQADSAWNYGIVAFDSIYDSQLSVGYSSTSFSSLQLDSIIVRAGHENNSFTTDTIIAYVYNVDANGYPGTNMLWSDTIFTNTGLSILNNWLLTTTLKFYPGLTIPGGKYSVQIGFQGALTDTFGILAGYGYLVGPCTTNPTFNLAQNTKFSKIISTPLPFFANSFSRWTQYGTQFPNPAGGNLYYECNGVAGQSGTDGANYMQNLQIASYVTLDFALGIQVSSPSVLCEGTATTITGTGIAGVPPYSFLWSPSTGLACDTCASTIASPSTNTNYILTITDGTLDTVIDSVFVTVYPNDLVTDFSEDITNLQVVYTSTSLNASNYSWTFGTGSVPNSAIGPGPHTITYTTGGSKNVRLVAYNLTTTCNDTLIKTLELSGVGIESFDETNKFILFQNTPNPFQESTQFSYRLKEDANVTYKISDVLGRTLFEFEDQNKKAGENSFIFQNPGLTSGVYFFSVQAKDQSRTQVICIE